ncbi:MAG: glutamate racemase [Patescibacteria group bacterium]|nr:glutamate racemase [Patescibacteria group bacterium]
MIDRPIGVIDSGLGGLSILQSLKKELPQESFIYLADHQFFPYGDKSNIQINKRLIKIIDYLLGLKIKIIVIACNTITTNSIKLLRQTYSIQFIGTEPAIKTAIEKNLKENIIVLATLATTKSKSFNTLLNKFDQKNQVKVYPCPGLVEIIESGNKQKIITKIKQILSNIKISYSTLVLGCTHYILIKDIIKKLTPLKTIIIEPSKAIAKQTKKILANNNLLSNIPSRDGMLLLTTGDSKKATQIASKLLKNSIIFDKCNI